MRVNRRPYPVTLLPTSGAYEGDTEPKKRDVWWWGAAWIPLALGWVVCVFVADGTRVECVTGSDDCGTVGNCTASVCMCPEPTDILPREYRCGDNADFVVNVADVVGICLGVGSLAVLFVTTCVVRKREEAVRKKEDDDDEEEEDTDETTRTYDLFTLFLSLTLLVLGVVLLSVSVWVIDPNSVAKPIMSVFVFVSFVCAVLAFLYCTPRKNHK